jgi:N-methylhydantoinase B
MTDAVDLSLTRDLLESIAEEMAETCVRAAASANVKERRDLSAAVFDAEGRMVAHAAHIPVHLGAMPMGVRAALARVRPRAGDVVLFNDPYEGGTHLPDVTALAALAGPRGRPAFHVAIRAHHADFGGAVPGSMAPADSVFAEGVRVPPLLWIRAGREQGDVLRLLLANVRDEGERRADLAAQHAALRLGLARLSALARRDGFPALRARCEALVTYAARIARRALRDLPDGVANAEALLAGRGCLAADGRPARLRVRLSKRGASLAVDFAGTSGPVGDGLNATAAVTASAVHYLVRCLCPADTPSNDGIVDPVTLRIPAGSLLDAPFPAPVAGGNVETSQRIVDVLWLAAARLWPGRFPAPGAGTMSNWTIGPAPAGPHFPTYYETVPAGAGGGPQRPGADAIQQHMTNTRNTPVEGIEARLPVRVLRFALRRGSGGRGRRRGGDGVVREVEALVPAVFAWTMTRHDDPPPGVAGGGAGKTGRVTLVRGGRARRLAARGRVDLFAGDVVRIETPGGGGWGRVGRGERPA